jgi:FixJ family two-component response regulator
VTQRKPSMKTVVDESPVVFVVDDDDSMRQALSRLFLSVKLRVEAFASPQQFLGSLRPDVPSCLVLDVRLPGLNGLDFQADLAKTDIRTPIVFISGHGDIPMTVRAMKAGAIDFLQKPFRDQDLLDAVAAAIRRDQDRRDKERSIARLKTNFETLTTREREIMTLVASGMMSKITVKVHRSHLMRKMGARTAAELVRMAEALGVEPTSFKPSGNRASS